jgi:hypothetical protein
MVIFAVAVVAVLGLTVMMSGQDKSKEQQEQRLPGIEDWSTRHSVFSNPGTFADATKNGAFAHWYTIINEPRYKMAQAKRNADRLRKAGGESSEATSDVTDSFGDLTSDASAAKLASKKTKPKPHGDWNNYLGGAANAGLGTNQYPAKYTWNTNATPNCTNDYVVVPINQSPANQSNATGSVLIHSEPSNGSTVTIGGTQYTFETSCSSASYCMTRSGTLTTDASELASAIGGSCDGTGTCTANTEVTGNANGTATVTLTPTAAYDGAAGNSVTMSTPSADDSAIRLNGAQQTSSSLSGGVDGQPSIVAFNELYSGGAVAATQIGTVSANDATAGQTLTINSVSLTASGYVQATGLITFNVNPTNADDVYITINGNDAYAFHDKLSDCGSDQCVLIGSSAVATASNLVTAINTGGGGVCVDHCSGSPDANVTASNAGGTSATVTLTAIVYGTGGNTIALAAAQENGSGETPSISGSDLGTGTGTVAGANATTSASLFAYNSSTGALLSTTALASNIVTAITENGTMGVSATSSGNVITVTASATGTTGNSIALTSGVSGFTWGGTTLVGGTNGGTCGSTGPSVTWAYSVGSTAAAQLGSPIISYDGTQVAFIESNPSGAILHVLYWSSEENTSLSASPGTPDNTSITGSGYATCKTQNPNNSKSCLLSVTLTSGVNNTNSPPFYNYAADTLYVGDDNGNLHEFSGVFRGTPTLTWTSSVHSTYKLTGPVYDFDTGNILVGDNDGYLNCVTSAGTACLTSHLALTNPILDAPTVDSSVGTVYAFVGGNGTATTSVTKATTALASASTLTIGGSTTSGSSQMHAGIFDNNYYNTGSGNLYVCGRGSGSNTGPVLYAITTSSFTLGAPTTGLPLTTTTTTAAQCSPLEEIYNPNQGGGTDWLFVGVPATCAYGTSTTGGCIMSFQITSGFPTSGAFAAPAETGGTSGIVADNVSTSTNQASSMYFVTLGNPTGGCTIPTYTTTSYCLVKVTQAGSQ